MAVVALTQTEKDELLENPEFKKYFTDNIFGDDHGGIGYLLRLTTFTSVAQALAYIVARQIRPNPQIVHADVNLITFFMIQMTVRDIDKKDDAGGGSSLDQVKAYLNASNRIEILLEDWFAEKAKAW